MSTRFSRRIVLFWSSLLFLYVASAVGSYVFFTLSRMVEPQTEMLSPIPSFSAFDLGDFPAPGPQSGINLLLLGYGGEGHPGGALSDTLIVVHVDPDEKRAVFTSVPRDLWVSFPAEVGGREQKINHAYAQGGGVLAKQIVGAVTGLEITHYLSVDFHGFREAVDLLDGVEVDVPVAFDDYWFPVPGLENEACGKGPEEVEEILTTLSGFEIDKQFPCRFEHIHFDKGKQLMDGETALKFVRSRHSAQHGGDFSRSQRTMALLVAVKNTLLSLGAADDALPFFNQLSHTIRTDLDEEAAEILLGELGDVSEYSTSQVLLSTDNVLRLTTLAGQSVLVPKSGDWKSVREHIQQQIDGE